MTWLVVYQGCSFLFRLLVTLNRCYPWHFGWCTQKAKLTCGCGMNIWVLSPSPSSFSAFCPVMGWKLIFTMLKGDNNAVFSVHADPLSPGFVTQYLPFVLIDRKNLLLFIYIFLSLSIYIYKKIVLKVTVLATLVMMRATQEEQARARFVYIICLYDFLFIYIYSFIYLSGGNTVVVLICHIKMPNTNDNVPWWSWCANVQKS